MFKENDSTKKKFRRQTKKQILAVPYSNNKIVSHNQNWIGDSNRWHNCTKKIQQCNNTERCIRFWSIDAGQISHKLQESVHNRVVTAQKNNQAAKLTNKPTVSAHRCQPNKEICQHNQGKNEVIDIW